MLASVVPPPITYSVVFLQSEVLSEGPRYLYDCPSTYLPKQDKSPVDPLAAEGGGPYIPCFAEVPKTEDGAQRPCVCSP